jgi:hypothetical protein
MRAAIGRQASAVKPIDCIAEAEGRKGRADTCPYARSRALIGVIRTQATQFDPEGLASFCPLGPNDPHRHRRSIGR